MNSNEPNLSSLVRANKMKRDAPHLFDAWRVAFSKSLDPSQLLMPEQVDGLLTHSRSSLSDETATIEWPSEAHIEVDALLVRLAAAVNLDVGVLLFTRFSGACVRLPATWAIENLRALVDLDRDDVWLFLGDSRLVHLEISADKEEEHTGTSEVGMYYLLEARGSGVFDFVNQASAKRNHSNITHP